MTFSFRKQHYYIYVYISDHYEVDVLCVKPLRLIFISLQFHFNPCVFIVCDFEKSTIQWDCCTRRFQCSVLN